MSASCARSPFVASHSPCRQPYTRGCVKPSFVCCAAQESGPVQQPGWLWSDTSSAAHTRAQLKAQQTRPKKSLGQNFVVDDSLLAAIVRQTDIRPGDAVLEIGPGTGNLTKYLLLAGASVTAIEKDVRLAEGLAQQFAQEPAFRLIHADVLELDLQGIVVASLQQTPSRSAAASESSALLVTASLHSGAVVGRELQIKAKVVANLPYYITKDCLKQVLPLGDKVSVVHFMLQDDVAQRLAVDGPGSSQYRVMNHFVNYYSRPEYQFRVDKSMYLPSPSVDGALVSFWLLAADDRLQVLDERGFFSMVNQAFVGRRKMLRNSLQVMFKGEEVAAALTSMGLQATARPQDLSLAQYVELYNAMTV